VLVLIHPVASLAALESLWRSELSQERLTVASPTEVEAGRRVAVRLEMPGPQLELIGTVRSARRDGAGFVLDIALAIRRAQMETLRKLADF
jgi:hypothetical protein